MRLLGRWLVPVLAAWLGACQGASILRDGEPHADAPRAPSAPAEPLAPATMVAPGEESELQRAVPLTRFLRLVQALEDGDVQRPVSILVIGDSHTASDSWTGPWRRRMARRLGSAGRGLSHPGAPWTSYAQQDMGFAQSEGWVAQHVVRTGFEGVVGLGGLSLTAPMETIATLSRTRCEGCVDEMFSVHLLRQPGGGSFWLRSGQATEPVHVTTDTGTGGHDFAQVSVPLDPARPTLTVETVGDGPVTILGVASDAAQRGVRVESLGINGAQFTHFLRADAAIVQAELLARRPDLVVLAMGTNEAFQKRYGPRDYPAEVCAQAPGSAGGPVHNDPEDSCGSGPHPRMVEDATALVARVRHALPRADCLLMLPPDTVATREAPPCTPQAIAGLAAPVCVARPTHRFERVQASLRLVALEQGCAIWDAQQAMGGPGSVRVWMAREPRLASADGIHLTRAGYGLLAQGLDEDLERAVETMRQTGKVRLETRALTPEHPLSP